MTPLPPSWSGSSFFDKYGHRWVQTEEWIPEGYYRRFIRTCLDCQVVIQFILPKEVAFALDDQVQFYLDNQFESILLAKNGWPKCAGPSNSLPHPPERVSPERALYEKIPALLEAVACPGENHIPGVIVSYSISYMVIHLNDQHQWTREQIADWLETLDVDLSFPTESETT